jgi:hypothetical protein
MENIERSNQNINDMRSAVGMRIGSGALHILPWIILATQ